MSRVWSIFMIVSFLIIIVDTDAKHVLAENFPEAILSAVNKNQEGGSNKDANKQASQLQSVFQFTKAKYEDVKAKNDNTNCKTEEKKEKTTIAQPNTQISVSNGKAQKAIAKQASAVAGNFFKQRYENLNEKQKKDIEKMVGAAAEKVIGKKKLLALYLILTPYIVKRKTSDLVTGVISDVAKIDSVETAVLTPFSVVDKGNKYAKDVVKHPLKITSLGLSLVKG